MPDLFNSEDCLSSLTDNERTISEDRLEHSLLFQDLFRISFLTPGLIVLVIYTG
jgi:hypothetical protein